MGRIKKTKREVEHAGRILRRLIGDDKTEPDVTRAILKLKDLTLSEVERVVQAAVKGGASRKSADRLAVFALVCKLLLIQRAFDEANRYERIVGSSSERGGLTLSEKLAHRNRDMAKEYRAREPVVGCLAARRELSEKWEVSLRQIAKALRDQGIEIAARKST